MKMRILLLLVFWIGFSLHGSSLAQEEPDERPRELTRASIEAMGGEAYTGIENIVTRGRYFRFTKGRKSFSKFTDWTVYDPIKWRFELADGDYVQIYNLDSGKAWTVERKDQVEEVPQEGIENFEQNARRDLFILLNQRLDEEGMNLYYYGPNDIEGAGEFEAVEFLDATNDSIVVYFDAQTHLPTSMEREFTDKVGVRHTEEQEFSNWHVIQGVNFPLRHDVYVDDEMSTQRFIEEVSINQALPETLFQEPVVEKK